MDEKENQTEERNDQGLEEELEDDDLDLVSGGDEMISHYRQAVPVDDGVEPEELGGFEEVPVEEMEPVSYEQEAVPLPKETPSRAAAMETPEVDLERDGGQRPALARYMDQLSGEGVQSVSRNGTPRPWINYKSPFTPEDSERSFGVNLEKNFYIDKSLPSDDPRRMGNLTKLVANLNHIPMRNLQEITAKVEESISLNEEDRAQLQKENDWLNRPHGQNTAKVSSRPKASPVKPRLVQIESARTEDEGKTQETALGKEGMRPVLARYMDARSGKPGRQSKRRNGELLPWINYPSPFTPGDTKESFGINLEKNFYIDKSLSRNDPRRIGNLSQLVSNLYQIPRKNTEEILARIEETIELSEEEKRSLGGREAQKSREFKEETVKEPQLAQEMEKKDAEAKAIPEITAERTEESRPEKKIEQTVEMTAPPMREEPAKSASEVLPMDPDTLVQKTQKLWDYVEEQMNGVKEARKQEAALMERAAENPEEVETVFASLNSLKKRVQESPLSRLDLESPETGFGLIKTKEGTLEPVAIYGLTRESLSKPGKFYNYEALVASFPAKEAMERMELLSGMENAEEEKAHWKERLGTYIRTHLMLDENKGAVRLTASELFPVNQEALTKLAENMKSLAGTVLRSSRFSAEEAKETLKEELDKASRLTAIPVNGEMVQAIRLYENEGEIKAELTSDFAKLMDEGTKVTLSQDGPAAMNVYKINLERALATANGYITMRDNEEQIRSSHFTEKKQEVQELTGLLSGKKEALAEALGGTAEGDRIQFSHPSAAKEYDSVSAELDGLQKTAKEFLDNRNLSANERMAGAVNAVSQGLESVDSLVGKGKEQLDEKYRLEDLRSQARSAAASPVAGIGITGNEVKIKASPRKDIEGALCYQSPLYTRSYSRRIRDAVINKFEEKRSAIARKINGWKARFTEHRKIRRTISGNQMVLAELDKIPPKRTLLGRMNPVRVKRNIAASIKERCDAIVARASKYEAGVLMGIEAGMAEGLCQIANGVDKAQRILNEEQKNAMLRHQARQKEKLEKTMDAVFMDEKTARQLAALRERLEAQTRLKEQALPTERAAGMTR